MAPLPTALGHCAGSLPTNASLGAGAGGGRRRRASFTPSSASSSPTGASSSAIVRGFAIAARNPVERTKRPRVLPLQQRQGSRTSRRDRINVTTNAVGAFFKRRGGDTNKDNDDQKDGGGLFAAKKRVEVRIPGLIFTVAPERVKDEGTAAAIEAAVAAGATAVVLSDEGGDATTRDLFNAALALKDALRGRAALLVADRTDIATSAEADGVVLSDDGVPVVVARRSFNGPCIVACRVRDAEGALVAAREGADLIFAPNPQVVAAVNAEISVPVFAPPTDGWAGITTGGGVTPLVEAGAQGVLLTSAPPDAAAAGGIPATIEAVRAALAKSSSTSANPSAAASATSSSSTSMAGKLLDDVTQAVLERERVLLDDAVVFLTDAVSALEEISLLVEARKGLEELFLLVIVGEFNAGKSSVINAILGAKFLKEGILPTTNEITVLRYGDTAKTEQSSDGFYTQFIPADLLKEVNIVDTPGTNVILERQQRLTEEFVPRADLVLFVLSADRPMTESEVKFLSYIRRWGKKVIFIVNKCDRLENPEEVAEVKGFVADNAERLLGLTDPTVLPVSAKEALKAKLGGSSLAPSGFGDLEDYVLSFLGGGGKGDTSGKSGSRSGEGLRLKLGTPLQVGTLLFDAAEDILSGEREAAAAEVAAATGVEAAMQSYRGAMEADFAAQRDAMRGCVLRATSRCDHLLDSTLRLTNGANLFATYILGNGRGVIREGYKAQVLGQAETELKAALAEHTGWLARNNERQLLAYEDAVRFRGFDPALTDLKLDVEMEDSEVVEEAAAVEIVAAGNDRVENERVAVEVDVEVKVKVEVEDEASGEEGALVAAEIEATKARDVPLPSVSSIVRKTTGGSTSPTKVASGFNQDAAAVLLEEEIREVVYSTVGAAGASFFVAIFLSGFLDNLAEDILALSLTAAVGYVSVLSLPLKRADAKGKVRTVAESFLREVEAAMEAEFELKVGAATKQVRATVAPWELAAKRTEAEVAANQAKRDQLAGDMAQLQRDVQSL